MNSELSVCSEDDEEDDDDEGWVKHSAVKLALSACWPFQQELGTLILKEMVGEAEPKQLFENPISLTVLQSLSSTLSSPREQVTARDRDTSRLRAITPGTKHVPRACLALHHVINTCYNSGFLQILK